MPNAPDQTLSGGRLAIVMITFMLLIMLTCIDKTVLATALVTITSEFDAVSDISWITSSFFIVQACFSLLFGKILNIAPPKIVLLVATAIFIVGSLLCAIASSARFLIAGRVVAGFGANGILVSVLSIAGSIGTLALRPVFIGLIASASGFSSLIGPVLGGVLTERINWRWCFYINLPIGGLAAILLIIFVPNLPNLTVHKKSALDTWLKLDWIGVFLNVAAVTLFMVGLQLGGNIKPWDNAGVILLLIIGVTLSVLFIAWEERKGAEAILLTAMLRRRNIVGCFLLVGLMHWIIYLAALYLPILYQLRGNSVLRSSVNMLPAVGAGVASGMISSMIVTITGHVWSWLFIPPFLATVWCTLMATSLASINASFASLAGYELLLGFSICGVQIAVVVAQAEYIDQEDLVPQATSFVALGGLIFSAIGTATSGDIFSGILRGQIQKLHLNLPASFQTEVLESIDAVLALPESLRSPIIGAYLTAIKRTFVSGIVISILAGLSALLVERKRIETKPKATARVRSLSLTRSLPYIMEPFEYHMLPARSDADFEEGNFPIHKLEITSN